MSEKKFKPIAQTYAEVLQLIGCEVSKCQLEFLEIKHLENDFHVNGKMAAPSSVCRSESSNHVLEDFCGNLWGQDPDTSVKGSQSGTFSGLYTVEKIDYLKRALSSKREWYSRITVRLAKTLHPHSLSEVLHRIGTELDANRARLLKLTKDGNGVLVQFQGGDGSQDFFYVPSQRLRMVGLCSFRYALVVRYEEIFQRAAKLCTKTFK